MIITHADFAYATSISTLVEGVLIFDLSLSWLASLLNAGCGVSTSACSLIGVTTRTGACAALVLRGEGNVGNFGNDFGEEVELILMEDSFFEVTSGNALTIAHT